MITVGALQSENSHLQSAFMIISPGGLRHWKDREEPMTTALVRLDTEVALLQTRSDSLSWPADERFT